MTDEEPKREPSRSVLITGGTGALGTAVTERFVESGHRVAVGWLVRSQAHDLEERLAAKAPMLVELDARDPASVGRAVAEVTERLGPVEVVVHLIGMWKGGVHLEDVDDNDWNDMFDVNLRTAFNMARAVLPSMRRQDFGRLIFIASRAAREGQARQIPYSVSKSAVAALAEAIADETRGTGITANAIAPSILDTEANRRAFPHSDTSAWVTPQEIADTIHFLASDSAGALRGAWVPAYGSA